MRGKLDLEMLINMEEQKFKEFAFVKGYFGLDKYPVYVAMQRELFNHPPLDTRHTSVLL